MADWYHKKVTAASLKELKRFVEWCNKFYGYFPVIIGGWVVYYYTKSTMSVDIDLV